MPNEPIQLDWSVTHEKVAEAIRRIVEAANPLQIIAFGSRARGDHRPDSDLDLAVILDAPEEDVDKIVPHGLLQGIRLPVDLVPVSKQKYDDHRPWLNSVYHCIDQEGIVLYDRQNPQSARLDALHTSPGGRVHTIVAAA
jgi:predicted nucleotidyltransferase